VNIEKGVLMGRLGTAEALEAYREEIIRNRDQNRTCITVCGGTGCSAWGGERVRQAFEEEIKRQGLSSNVEIKKTGCHGFCERGPITVILPQEIFYQKLTVEDVQEVVQETLINQNIVGRFLYTDPVTNTKSIYEHDVPFYKKQKRVVFRDNGRIDPTDINDYVRRGGYAALGKVLTSMTSEKVIDVVEKAVLRGRGGAGFPTGTKWRFTREAPGKVKYLICNADEGDPGAFMDRSVLEGNPHLVLEGMVIAAYAVGCQEGYVYVRAEYPLAIKHLRTAITQAREKGLLGENILGNGFSFDIKIKEGAGAFVCGEETALMASIEGRRGMPRARPPFPAQAGLWGKPTCINNVETFANIRTIILDGEESFASIGTERSTGTKIFSLTGRINNTGLVEVPMGTTLREVIYDIGGGITRGRRFKAVQMGGPSGGCVPAMHLDLPIDYDSLQDVGSIMGSGGMVVMDENNCMVDIARFFLSFTQAESCGKCSPCRLGTAQMLSILDRITRGEGVPGDIERLIEIGETVRRSSLCGLGQTCANPVLSTIRYFRDEYEAHIQEKKCPAASCEAIIISACQHACPAGIDVPNYVAYVAESKFFEAAELIRERNPFPAICGRICHHPCEFKCRRGELDDSVGIRALKRVAADWYYTHVDKDPEPFPIIHDQRVATIGAGPAGLSCAFYLRQMGYRTTVFEAQPVGGGMMGWVIPDFRLPKEVIQREIQYIKARGVEIHYNEPITSQRRVEDLLQQGFDAVFIAAGAQRSQRIGIPGELEGIDGLIYGLGFLRDVKVGKSVQVGRRVAVLGGGNTALDGARTARRLGADEVHIYYRRSREEMPVTAREYHEAVDEGIEFHFLTNPTRIVHENWQVKGLECIQMELGEADETGRRRPVPIEGTEFFVEADTVIPAVGQAPDLSFLPEDTKLERARWGALQVSSNTLATNIPGIFAGGDFVTGPTTVIQAIAAGRRAALAIDKYFRGDDTPVEIRDEKCAIDHEVEMAADQEELEERQRVEIPMLPPERRIKGFMEVESGYTEEQAMEEAKRCLRCDLETD
jgi:NADH-quinone oxidoreductase subunit F